MAGTMDSLRTINSLMRTLLATIVVGGLAIASWKAYSTYYAHEIAADQQRQEVRQMQDELDKTRRQLDARDKEIESQAAKLQQQETEIANLNADVARLDTALRLLKVDHRLARLSIVDQRTDDDTGKTETEVEFVELNDEGASIEEPRTFRIRGEVIYIDNWVVKFNDEYIEKADLDRATSLVLFRRIFGDQQEPREGAWLDVTNRPPRAYTRGGVVSDFEKRIWDDFWTIANDETKAKELGIRAAHGEAVSIKAEKGKVYKLQLRASDGLSIVPDDGRSAPRL